MADIKISQLGEALAVTDNDILPMTASGVTSKVKASTMKSYMVDDLDVSDLHDTTITTPADGDGLVYDATAQKWKNKQITTKEQWQKNGAYNLYQMDMSSQVISGVTFTKISEGTFSLNTNGTLTGAINIDINPAQLFPAGTYKFLGAPSGVTNLGFAYIYQKGGTWYTIADGDTFTTDGTETTGWVRVYLYVGCNLDGTEIFKPMITTDLNATYADYVPYAKTNRELTENEPQISLNGNGSTYVLKTIIIDDVCIFALKVKKTAVSWSICTCPLPLADEEIVGRVNINGTTADVVVCHDTNQGVLQVRSEAIDSNWRYVSGVYRIA